MAVLAKPQAVSPPGTTVRSPRLQMLEILSQSQAISRGASTPKAKIIPEMLPYIKAWS